MLDPRHRKLCDGMPRVGVLSNAASQSVSQSVSQSFGGWDVGTFELLSGTRKQKKGEDFFWKIDNSKQIFVFSFLWIYEYCSYCSGLWLNIFSRSSYSLITHACMHACMRANEEGEFIFSPNNNVRFFNEISVSPFLSSFTFPSLRLSVCLHSFIECVCVCECGFSIDIHGHRGGLSQAVAKPMLAIQTVIQHISNWGDEEKRGTIIIIIIIIINSTWNHE